MRAAIYRRVSTAQQVDGFSLDSQLDQLTTLANQREFIWEDFCDPGVSGETLDGRPALVTLLSRLDDFDALLVVDDSRLARDERVAFLIRHQLRQAGVRLITLAGETDLNNPTDRFTSGMFALVAQFEQDLRRAKMMTGLDAAARHGYWTGGPPPYGWRPEPTDDGHTTLTIYEPEAEVLRTAIDLIIDGATPYEACKQLAILGYRTRTGTLWGHRNLWNHLTRRRLLGEFPYQSTNGTIQRQFPPLITEDRYQALQAALKRRYKGPKTKHRTYPLSGRLQCACGQSHLVGVYRKDRDTRYYMCTRNISSAVTNDKCPIHPRQQRAQPIEDTIWTAITDTLTDRDQLTDAVNRWNAQHDLDAKAHAVQIAALTKRLSEIKAERLRTFRDARRLGLDDLEVETLLDDLATEHDTIQRQLDQADTVALAQDPTLTDLDQLITNAPNLLLEADDNTRAQILDLLHVQVTPTDHGYHIDASIPLDAHTTPATGYIATLTPPTPGLRQRRYDRVASPGPPSDFRIPLTRVSETLSAECHQPCRHHLPSGVISIPPRA
jgi:DNA invertase Pin-like site-specific DNA recombinase